MLNKYIKYKNKYLLLKGGYSNSPFNKCNLKIIINKISSTTDLNFNIEINCYLLDNDKENILEEITKQIKNKYYFNILNYNEIDKYIILDNIIYLDNDNTQTNLVLNEIYYKNYNNKFYNDIFNNNIFKNTLEFKDIILNFNLIEINNIHINLLINNIDIFLKPIIERVTPTITPKILTLKKIDELLISLNIFLNKTDKDNLISLIINNNWINNKDVILKLINYKYIDINIFIILLKNKLINEINLKDKDIICSLANSNLILNTDIFNIFYIKNIEKKRVYMYEDMYEYIDIMETKYILNDDDDELLLIMINKSNIIELNDMIYNFKEKFENKEFLLKVIKIKPSEFLNFDIKFKNDKDFSLECIKSNYNVFNFLNPEFTKDSDFIINAIIKNYNIIKIIKLDKYNLENIYTDLKIIKHILINNYQFIELFIDNNDFNKKINDIILQAIDEIVNINNECKLMLNKSYKCNINLTAIYIKNNLDKFIFLPDKLKKDDKFLLKIIKFNPNAISYFIDKNENEDFLIKSIIENENTFNYINNKFKNIDFILKIIEKDSNLKLNNFYKNKFILYNIILDNNFFINLIKINKKCFEFIDDKNILLHVVRNSYFNYNDIYNNIQEQFNYDEDIYRAVIVKIENNPDNIETQLELEKQVDLTKYEY